MTITIIAIVTLFSALVTLACKYYQLNRRYKNLLDSYYTERDESEARIELWKRVWEQTEGELESTRNNVKYCEAVIESYSETCRELRKQLEGEQTPTLSSDVKFTEVADEDLPF